MTTNYFCVKIKKKYDGNENAIKFKSCSQHKKVKLEESSKRIENNVKNSLI